MEAVLLILIIAITSILSIPAICYTIEQWFKYNKIHLTGTFIIIPIVLGVWLGIACSYPLKIASEQVFRLETVKTESGISQTYVHTDKGLKNLSEKFGAVYDDKKFVYKVTKYEAWYCGINFHESEYSRIEELK